MLVLLVSELTYMFAMTLNKSPLGPLYSHIVMFESKPPTERILPSKLQAHDRIYPFPLLGNTYTHTYYKFL
jgi:hypothetical protein